MARRGLATIDPDFDPELSYWEDEAGNRVLLADGPPALDQDRQWLRGHHWVWNRFRMEELFAQQDGPVFVCGIALNLDQFLDLFDHVFLLQIDEATQEARLVAYDEGNPPGRSAAARQQIREGRSVFEAQMVKSGAIVLDGTAPTTSVADDLLAHVSAR